MTTRRQSRPTEPSTTSGEPPGERVIVPPVGSCGTAKDRMEDDGVECEDWFFCTKELSESTIAKELHV